MLLRTAIGWHFLYEGVYKINTTEAQRDSWAGSVLTKILPAPHDKDKDVEPPFSAEGYLRNATGPLAPRFRAMVPDVNSFAKLERDSGGLPTRLKEGWKREMDRIASHFQFTDEQRALAEKELARSSAKIDAWFLDPENAQKIKKYDRDVRHVRDVESSPDSLPYQRTQAYKDRADVEKARKELVNAIDADFGALRDAWLKLPTGDQRKAAGSLTTPWTQIDWINVSTMWGLALVGLCLMLGLFTRLAALGGAAYLLMFYLSMPPWPGLPVGKAAEGHYLYVNKNLIELIACLAIAMTASGHWLGLDALLFGRWRRRRSEAQAPTSPATEVPLGSAVPVAQSGRSGQPTRHPKR
ncbi:MAG: putative rane protein [Planctomycetota bacterium]|nr:putative rane protein [Planctomycetota bacterium]